MNCYEIDPSLLAVLTGAKGRDLIEVLGDTGKTQLAFGLLFTIGLSIIV